MVDGPDALSKEAQRNATLLFFSHLRATFASKRVLREYKLTPEAFDWILGEVETRFNQVKIPCRPCLSAASAMSILHPAAMRCRPGVVLLLGSAMCAP